MKRTVYIYERLNWETGVKKRAYSYTLNPELGEVIGTKEVEVEEPEKNNNDNLLLLRPQLQKSARHDNKR